MIEFGHGTHRGLRRDINEDTYYADPGCGIFLVADGMGGRNRGDRVAAVARDCVAAEVGGGTSLHDAVALASRCVMEACPATSAEAAPVGTTLAALRLIDNGFETAWIGDCRVYLWHAQCWYELSHARENLQPLIEQGLVHTAEPGHASRPTAVGSRSRRHGATQALGVTPLEDLEMQTLAGRCAAGMRFLICSDGLGDGISDACMRAIVARDDLGAQECVDQLIRQGLDAGGQDNLTAVMVRLS